MSPEPRQQSVFMSRFLVAFAKKCADGHSVPNTVRRLHTDEAKRMADLAAAEAEIAAQQQSDYGMHAAEPYVSKAGHRESTDQTVKPIGDIGQDMRGVREWPDNFIDRARKPP